MAAVMERTQRVPHFAGAGRIVWRDRPIPTPGVGELLLSVRANALCGTDRGQLAAGSDVTPGHEAAGEVASAGHGTSTAVGTRGVAYLMDYCGACRPCAEGATNQCLAKRADMGFTRDGGFGQYELLHETNFFPVDAATDFGEATLLLDVMGTTSHAIRRAQTVRPGIGSLLVGGAGPVGLGAVAMARLLLGPDVTIMVTDAIPYRLQLARRLGAIPVDVRHDSLGQALRAAGVTTGVDAVIDTTGRETARRDGLDALGRQGVLVCVGHGEGLSLSVSADLIAPERTVMGSEYFRYDALGRNLELLRRHRTYLAQIITHRFEIRELDAAYRTFMAGDTGKVVVEQ